MSTTANYPHTSISDLINAINAPATERGSAGIHYIKQDDQWVWLEEAAPYRLLAVDLTQDGTTVRMDKGYSPYYNGQAELTRLLEDKGLVVGWWD